MTMQREPRLQLVQLTEEDVKHSSTLDPEDAGKWCFIVQGCLMGFFDTREEAETRLLN